ncbi:DMT family transporter [Paenibacillus alginolyticus]|uniref:DMT family transporter n=1 Tax=Paenibacillus alginolyticus TaxID=59839 RepID=UPI0003F71087|nr:DMT family transporter [Paenibacillus alginolyticus]MCY9667821.1 DMT family transporter [Paenibacillus alginolyticus]
MNRLIFFLCFIWGSNWVVMKAAGDYFPPMMFSAIRFLMGTFVLFIVIYLKRIPLPKKEDWKWYTVCGLLQTTWIYAVNQPALQYVNAGIVCILGFTMPFWLSIMAHFLIPGERLTWNKTIGLVLGIGGLFFVMNINPFHMQWSGTELFIELLIISGAIAWAVANLIIKVKLQNNDKFQFTAYQMGIGALALLCISLFYEQGQTITWNWVSFSYLFFAGVIASALAYVLWFYILSKVEASKASITLLFIPVIGVLSVWLFLGEPLDVKTLFGMAMVVSGIAMVNKKMVAKIKIIENCEHAG